MAEEKKAEPEAPAKKPGRSIKTTLLICGFMGVVVAVECALAFMIVPSAEEVADIAKEQLKREMPEVVGGGLKELAPKADTASAAVEVELGDYSITVSQANSSLSLRVDFQLFGTVIEKDKSKLVASMERNKHRFRENIILRIRDSSHDDLDDPSLALIKRRILETSNDLLGTPLLESVVFSQFSYIEQ